jgi:site-specific DNA recombinase
MNEKAELSMKDRFKKLKQARRRKHVPPVRTSRVVAYIRVSTARQVLEGHSLEAQQAQLEAYARLHDLEIVSIESDAGESASSLERPGLKRALERLDRFEAQGILVVKLDRLTRSVQDFCDLIDTYFRDGTCALMSVSESIDTSTAAGRLVLNVLMLFSQWEREAAAERTSVVMERLKETGKFTGGWPPYGWSVDEDGALVADVEEQLVIARARDLRTAGHSLRAIAAAVGPNNRNGKEFDHTQIARML